MPEVYDNWEKLLGAVLKKEQLWELFHADSISLSFSSSSSGFSFGRLTSSLDDVPFSFSSPEWAATKRKDDDFGTKTAAPTHSNVLVVDQSPDSNITFIPPRKRDLKIEVPKLRIQDGNFSPNISPRTKSSTPCSRVNPRIGGGHSESQSKWADDAKQQRQQSYPLPLPPEANSYSSPVSRPNSAAKSTLPSPERAENVKSFVTSWKKGKLIGRSPQGGVFLGFNSEKGQMCAMKEVSLSSDDPEVKHNARMLEKEIGLLSLIDHPNIVQYYGSEMVANNFYIYYEYMSAGTIYMILQQYGRLGESAIRRYTQQILSGIAYLHSKHISHRDIKGANILVDSNGRVKLANFGVEKYIAERLRTSWLTDSPYWAAPEVIMNPNVQNLATDIWSLGCTVLEMATSKPPLSQYNGVTAMHKVAYHNEIPTIPHYLSDVFKDFLRHCLQSNPLHRATASQLLEHPFVKNFSPMGKQIVVSTSSGHPAVTNAVKSVGIDHARSPHQVDSGKVAFRSSKASKSKSQTSDLYTPRNISAPVSPASPLLYPRSPQHLNERMSPPPKSSLHAASKPIVSGIGATPHTHINQSTLQQETSRNLPNQSRNINSPSYWDPNILQGRFRFS